MSEPYKPKDSPVPFKSSDSSAKKPQATLSGVLVQLAGRIFKREAAMIITATVVLIGAGAGGAVWAQEKMDAAMNSRVSPLEKRQEKVEADVAQVKQQVANVERVAMETNLNVRLIAERLRIVPITIEAKDGGQ